MLLPGYGMTVGHTISLFQKIKKINRIKNIEYHGTN